jgi:ParB family chromosome partitioning protein
VSDRRRGLGRGLAALIPTGAPETSGPPTRTTSPGEAPAEQRPPAESAAASTPDAAAEPAGSLGAVPAHYLELPLDSITPNPRQPRQVFDEDALAELVHSIREIGLLQPVVVRPVPGSAGAYELVAGERRLRAAREAGLATIPAIVRDTADDDLLRDALLENLHRAQLNALEEASAYQQLLEDFGCTQEELATRIGRSRPQVSNTLRLLKLPPGVQRRVAAGVLSAGHAKAILSLDDPEAMEHLSNRIVAEGLSVRAVEELVILGEADGRERRSVRRPRGRKPTAPGLSELASRLSDSLETRVTIDAGRQRGKVVIEFATLDDLQRIVGIIEGG